MEYNGRFVNGTSFNLYNLEEGVTNEIEEYKNAGVEIDGTLFSQDMINMCDDKIEKFTKENLDMF